MPKKVRAAHILVKTESEAKVILFDLKRGASFEEIAKEKSLCPSRKKGGDLGWFGRGQMVKEFEQAAFSTPKGQLSDVVKTQFGYHIIKVLEAK
ncbi:peptidylprolyl isomerase [candidate division KSB1 bacterium]